MPAKSKAQQRFMGMVHAAQKGEKPASKAVAKVAKSIKKKDAEDFASTKHKGLPKKVKQETKVRSLIRKMVREIMAEMKEGGPGSGPQGDDDNPFDREPSDDELADIEKEYEGVDEGFAGALKKEDRDKFDNMRRKQSEVLGYTLTGTNDVKTEIDDATIKEASIADKFQKNIKRYQDRVDKEKAAYRRAREAQKKLNKEENLDKVAIPGNVKRFMGRFIDAVKGGKLTRQRQKAILYKVVKGLGISPQELMIYIQKIKKGL
jgi:hypothetical protein